jgi:hypothetical protein
MRFCWRGLWAGWHGFAEDAPEEIVVNGHQRRSGHRLLDLDEHHCGGDLLATDAKACRFPSGFPVPFPEHVLYRLYRGAQHEHDPHNIEYGQGAVMVFFIR